MVVVVAGAAERPATEPVPPGADVLVTGPDWAADGRAGLSGPLVMKKAARARQPSAIPAGKASSCSRGKGPCEKKGGW